MKARLRYLSKVTLVHRTAEKVAVAELKVWEVGVSVHYPDGLKFSLFLVEPMHGEVILGIDNHKPKGPHLHWDGREVRYQYSTVEKLIEDFWRLVAEKGYQ